MHIFNLCTIKIKLSVYTQVKRKSWCVVKNKPLMKSWTYQIFVERWRESTVPQIHTWTHIFNSFPIVVFQNVMFDRLFFVFFKLPQPFLLQCKMAPSWIWTCQQHSLNTCGLKVPLTHWIQNEQVCGLWGGLVSHNHYHCHLFFNVNISLVMSDCQCKTPVCYLWSCVYNPPVGAGTWPPRPRSEGRWGWGRRAAEGGTTRRCWWGLVDVGRKISQYK